MSYVHGYRNPDSNQREGGPPCQLDPTIRNIIARYLSPENNRDLDILAATTGAARGKKVTRQQMAAELIVQGLKAHKINMGGG